MVISASFRNITALYEAEAVAKAAITVGEDALPEVVQKCWK
jgi:hypothetical protein